MTHTQGPWETFGPLLFTVYGGDPKRRIAVIDYTQGNETEESRANARLISAAPELLAALQAISNHAPDLPAHAAVNIARAALAKALGE